MLPLVLKLTHMWYALDQAHAAHGTSMKPVWVLHCTQHLCGASPGHPPPPKMPYPVPTGPVLGQMPQAAWVLDLLEWVPFATCVPNWLEWVLDPVYEEVGAYGPNPEHRACPMPFIQPVDQFNATHLASRA